jgi:hypothetical protein
MAIGRRRFLQLSALGIAAIAADSGCSLDAGSVEHPQLLSMLGDDRVRQLGMHYRALTPAESSADALRTAISSARGTGFSIGKRSIDDDIRDDFAAGRTVLVDGWVLSVTEARQAALFSLTPA